MFSFFYNLAIGLYSLTYLPKIFSAKYTERRKFKLPNIQKTSKPLIWVHAVSVGETKAVAKLAEMLKKHFDATLVISNITGTGHQEAKKTLPFADYHILLPLDLSWTMKPLIEKVKPDLVILTETDFWYHFLKFSHEAGACIALVNGKISDRSYERLQAFPWIAKRLYQYVDLFCVQSDSYANKFHALGVPKDKIHAIPNLKYDDSPAPFDPSVLEAFKKQLGIQPDDYVVVAGSTHPGEESLILEAFFAAKIPRSKLLIVPRHPERFNAVADDLRKNGVLFSRFSEAAPPQNVILIDAMGVLRKCYAVGSIALVGGSFVPGIGGHNILEPAFFQLPVLFGPFMEGQAEMCEIVLKYKIGEQVKGEDLAENLKLSVSKEKIISALESIQGGVKETFREILHKYACEKSSRLL